MADGERREDEAADSLSEGETDEVAHRQAGSAKVVHEVIRLQGEEELDRTLASLAFSGFAAGLAISASILAEASLKARLPEAGWAPLVTDLGYCVGFVIVVLGNLQLFTESTVTAVLPIATHPTLANVGRLLRLWAVVLAANLTGTLLVAQAAARGWIVSAEQLRAMLTLATEATAPDGATILLRGVPAGFLIASVAWILPNARGSEFWVVVALTYVIAIGGFSHVVAGSAEAWLVWAGGRASLGDAVGGYILPALAGNVLGGTGLFAILAHGQVRDEIVPDGEDR